MVNLALGRPREDRELKVSLGYTVRLYLRLTEVIFRSLAIKVGFIGL